MRPLSFSPPDIREEDIDAVCDVLRSGWITTGPETGRFEELIATQSGTSRSVAMSSATAALEASLRFLGVGPGDEVIVPAYTYTATASVVHHVGARAVIVDTPGSTPHLRSREIDAAIGPNTKAVISVDLAGIPADYRSMQQVLEARRDEFRASSPTQEALGRVALIADAAHSIGASTPLGPVGSLADLTTYSFHAVKNLVTAEGGAVTWSDASLFGRSEPDMYLEMRRDVLHGQTKDALSKSKAGSWEYDIVELGFKSNMTDIQAALGVSQIGRLPELMGRRQAILRRYEELLANAPVELLDHFDNSRSSAHLAISFLPEPDEGRRASVIEALAAKGIPTNVHYKPLTLLTAYRALGWRPEDTPGALAYYQREITLPLHTLLSDDDVDRVAAAVRDEVTR